MKEKKDILRHVKEEAENIAIPESITSEKIRQKLERIEADKVKAKYDRRRELATYIAMAAGICLLLGGTYMLKAQFGGFIGKENTDSFIAETDGENTITGEYVDIAEESELLVSIEYPEITYEDIYESMFGNLEEMKYQSSYRGDMVEGYFEEEVLLSDGAIPEAPAGDDVAGSLSEAPTGDKSAENIVFNEYAASENKAAGALADSVISEKSAVKEDAAEYGTTNVQTQGVEEADVVKNDGRYLYQKIYQEKDQVYTQAIQIVDTKDGLKEIKRIEGFENIQEFYIWDDILVIIENKYLETVQTNTYAEEKMMICGVGNWGSANQYHEITFYSIKDRSIPHKIKTFTLRGRYDSSRIADGYFYGFSKFYAGPGEGETDYESYVPLVDGTRLKADRILLPEENEGNCYLVLTSIDMKNPTKFVDTTAIITDSDLYYVSSDNIYIADSLGFQKSVGKQTNQVSLLRFSYDNGYFALQAEGKVPGSLESSFSMDEYKGNLRMVTTVDEYWFEEVKDDRTGEIIGNHMVDEKQANALYVLDQNLEIVGKIENLAKDERIYSARFMGDTGYFVTFRQTDPLFAVDLKDPKNPKILSELKISGFSEYLHFYGEERLLGIGMEADEETGRTEGMKLSMFDISDPAKVTEITKLPLSKYDYSEALYNHRAVMISVTANLFGLEAEGYENGDFKKDYLVFSYEDDKFVQKLKVETNNKYGEIHSSRGTFIGDVFYLLTRNGNVTSYDLQTGEELDSLG